MIESELNQRFKFILNGTPEAEEAKAVCTDYRTQDPSTNASSPVRYEGNDRTSFT